MQALAPENKHSVGKKGRIPGLDGLRALAIVPVLFIHGIPDRVPGGFLGVELFFVISGYIITVGLLAEHERSGRISLTSFFARRFWRLVPVLLVVIVVAAVLGALIGGRWSTPDTQRFDALSALTSTMNIRRAFWGGGESYLGHTWSLSMEEQFYLLWPAGLALVLWAGRRQSLPGLLTAAILLVTIWRLCLGADGAGTWRLYAGFDTQLDALLAGCALALIGTSGVPRLALRLWLIPAAGFILLTLTVPLEARFLAGGALTLTLAFSLWLIIIAVENRGLAERILAARPMQWIGLRSYSLYLWHVPVLGLVALLDLKVRYALPLFLVLAFAAAAISYKWIELPLQRRPQTIGPPSRKQAVV